MHLDMRMVAAVLTPLVVAIVTTWGRAGGTSTAPILHTPPPSCAALVAPLLP
jgi:hypothetical protein